MHKLEQFRTSLLFGRINVLIALHDVDVDSQLAGLFGERLVFLGDFRITLWAEIPYGGGIFDQESEIVLIQQRQKPRRIRADEIVHASVEAIVHVREHEIEVGLGLADGFDLCDPFFLPAMRQFGAIIQKHAQLRGFRWGALEHSMDRSRAGCETRCERRCSWE